MKHIFEKFSIIYDTIKYSIKFFQRRRKITPREIDLIIVDLDGTLTSTKTFKEALKLCLHKKSEAAYLGTMFQNKEKKLTIDNLRMLKAVDYLKQGDFQKKYEDKILKKALKNINEPLLSLLQCFPKKQVIIISKSSSYGARQVAQKLSLSAGYGSTLIYDKNGHITGAQKLVTDIIPSGYEGLFTTKEEIAKNHMQELGMKFSMARTAVFTNDILDAELLSKSGIGVVVKNNKNEFFEKLTIDFKLYDLLMDKNLNEIKHFIL